MLQRGPFWNIRIALAMAVVAGVVFISVFLSGERDNGFVVAILVFPVLAIVSISHAITNKTLVFVPWKTYMFTAFERWCGGVGFAIYIGALLASELLKRGQ